MKFKIEHPFDFFARCMLYLKIHLTRMQQQEMKMPIKRIAEAVIKIQNQTSGGHSPSIGNPGILHFYHSRILSRFPLSNIVHPEDRVYHIAYSVYLFLFLLMAKIEKNAAAAKEGTLTQ